MGFRARKSIKIVPGVRLNVSKTGVGASIGGRGARYTAHSSGRRTVSARTGIPGVSYQKSVGGGRRVATTRQTAARTAAPSPVKPGMFAPKGEKQLYKAIKQQDVQAMKRVGDEHPDFRLASYSLSGLLMLMNDPATATRLLSEAFSLGRDPGQDKFITKYVHAGVELGIAPGVTAELPVGRDAVGLALAELKQDAEDPDGAISIVEQLEPTTYAAVSLAELYVQVGRFNEVIQLTEKIKNQDDATALLLVYRGIALRSQGFHDAAHQAFKEALRSRSRDAAIRHLALSERARNFAGQGKKSMARKDLERILAEDSSYEGIRERLAELT
jgi:tetratricopeptide (TPR) repeat protein